jgi:hypothetical protein
MRTASMTGSSAPIHDWLAGRQTGRFLLMPTGRARPPAPRPPADPDATRRSLDELHARGVIDDGELAALRERLHL